MNHTRRLAFALLFVLFCLSRPLFALSPLQQEMLDALARVDCQDEGLRHAVLMDRFADLDSFRQALSTTMGEKLDAELAADTRGSGSFTDEIMGFARKIADLDRDRIPVQMDESGKSGMLFRPLPTQIPASYEATFRLARRFDPRDKTNDHQRLNGEIDKYLHSLEHDPCIRYALETTGTTLAQLKANWFGSGLGFEHVMVGEVKKTAVSGFHFWYHFYREEREGRARYQQTLAGADDPRIFTGRFRWDPDGDSGSLPAAEKSKGGFTIGCSAPALLALGHLAIEIAKRRSNCPSAFSFKANINGQNYRWQMYTVGRSIRSLYPMIEKAIQQRGELQREARETVLDSALELAR